MTFTWDCATLISTIAAALIVAVGPALAQARQAEPVGKRPYEMVWASRTQDANPPLVDFENLDGWTVDCKNAIAQFQRSREQQIWGQYVGKLTYKGTGPQPVVRIEPPAPVPIPHAFDAVSLWVYGNNWGWAPDPGTPQVLISVVFEDSHGQEFTVDLYHVNWEEWYLLYERLTPEQIERVKAGAHLKAIQVTGGSNTEDRALYFDNLAVFTEAFPPLQFEPRPVRNLALFAGQSPGLNTGPGKLPFPTREETILPPNLTEGHHDQVRADGKSFVLDYTGRDGHLTYRLTPASGGLDDVTAQWMDANGKARGGVFQPCAGGGIRIQTPNGPRTPDHAALIDARIAPDDATGRPGVSVVRCRWRLSAGGVEVNATLIFHIWGKSLVIDILAPGGQVGEVRYGHESGMITPRLVTNPYYPSAEGRPAVVVSGPQDRPLFLAGNTDWYRSNASVMFAENGVSAEGATYNGGTRYIAKTDGRRNDCFERLFVTVSPQYVEVLPSIPNPKSPWMNITGTHLWRAHGASDRKADAAFWTDCHRWGMTQVVVTDHETMWRDNGESFTFRTRCAPGKGGDQGEYDYARLMQDKLGFVYGPYNNYTDFAPVNQYWSVDRVSRTPDNQLEHAWMRCYAPKPAYAVEACEKLAPEIQKKFHFSTAYCDVHTAVAPWDRVDYDPRVPGAGTFAATYYAFGEIMLIQKKAWNGPVYSEGGNHCFYCGLTDGNYGQDQSYQPSKNPWLVDFDLTRLHNLCCNFGMGNPDMFYAGTHPLQQTSAEQDAWLDRFLAATVAFGHPGFLVYEGGVAHALRSYYMIQQLASHYCLARASEIRYATADGRLLDSTAAVATGAFRRSQVVTRYSDGTITAVNGNATERMVVDAYGRALDLPPNGYCGWTADGSVDVISSDPGHHRCDYAVTPAYIYVDGRGKFVRFPKAAGNGIGICRTLPAGWEVLLYRGADCGFAVQATSAEALDHNGNVIGPASLRVSRGLTYVIPVDGAFSYRLLRGVPAASVSLTCTRDLVVAGESVTITGREAHAENIPATARPGQRIWSQKEGSWIDFTVAPLADVIVQLEGNRLHLDVVSHLPAAEDAHVRVGIHTATARVTPGQEQDIVVDLGEPAGVTTADVPIDLDLGGKAIATAETLQAVSSIRRLDAMPAEWLSGICERGKPEQSEFDDTGGLVRADNMTCGGVTRQGVFMSPPYKTGVGYSFARYSAMGLPARVPAAFRAMVGKGDGSDPGDGVWFEVRVVDAAGHETTAGRQSVAEHTWLPIEADLARWAGQKIQIKLVSDVGPNNNSIGDWACWGDLRIETLSPVLHWALAPVAGQPAG